MAQTSSSADPVTIRVIQRHGEPYGYSESDSETQTAIRGYRRRQQGAESDRESDTETLDGWAHSRSAYSAGTPANMERRAWDEADATKEEA